MSRRLPVYLLLDCSESMAGEALVAVQHGVETMVAELRQNPHALETAFLSIITFAGEARLALPLSEVAEVQVPHLAVRPGTALGAALRLLMRRLAQDIVRTTAERKGDYRPLVFLLTDGQPTDDWDAAVDELRRFSGPKAANIYAIGCGPDIDYGTLSKVTDIVLQLPDVTPEKLAKLFVWLTASIRTASASAEKGNPNDPVGLDALPADVLLKAEDRPAVQMGGRPRQVFLHSRCEKDGRPYLMRFAWHAEHGKYLATASHPIEEFGREDAARIPPLDSSQLLGCPSCPYCENPLAGLCGNCKTVFCSGRDPAASLVCPSCHAKLSPGGGGDFELPQSAG